ncbi:unnamed protein product, partial [Vitis vinifera]|uniref:Uncharacterized protein n=1 Tax=Vitis vinifera TaxID=29760 RepID=D7TIH4_VITVI
MVWQLAFYVANVLVLVITLSTLAFRNLVAQNQKDLGLSYLTIHPITSHPLIVILKNVFNIFNNF